MVDLKTKYDDAKKVAVIVSREIKVTKRDYEAVQTITNGQFGYFAITGLIELRKGSITGLNLSGLEVQASDLLPDLANLTSLERLNLSHNPLKNLPGCIGKLKNLKELYISHTQLTSLPEWTERLISLEELYAGFSEIKYLPKSMKRMKSLEYFVIRSNPLDDKAKALIRELKKSGVKIV